MSPRKSLRRACRKKAKWGQSTVKLETTAHSLGERRSQRLAKRADDDSSDTLNHFEELPTEIILRIFESVDEKSLVQLRKTCSRFRNVILSSTKRVDQTLMQVDPAIGSDRAAVKLILNCPGLRVLSLIDSSSPGKTQAYLSSAINYGPLRNEIGDLLSYNCPRIQMIDVASINGLRLVERYVKRLNGSSELQSLRVFSSNIRTLVGLLLNIVEAAPKLTTFKLLRRTLQRGKASKHRDKYEKLWTLMGQQLINFSTNVSDRGVLANCLTEMVHLKRIVIWHLEEDEVHTLMSHSRRLESVLLMDCPFDAFKHLVHLPELKDLTFHAKPITDNQLPAHFAEELHQTFQQIGARLDRLSLILKNISTGTMLSPMVQFCVKLRDLKLRDVNTWDYSWMYYIIKSLPALVRLDWSDNGELNGPENRGRPRAEELLLESKNLTEIFTVVFMPNEATGQADRKLYKYHLIPKQVSMESSRSEQDIETLSQQDLSRKDQFTVQGTLVAC